MPQRCPGVGDNQGRSFSAQRAARSPAPALPPTAATQPPTRSNGLRRRRSARDHRHHRFLREQPAEGELQDRVALRLRERDEVFDEVQILLGERPVRAVAFGQPSFRRAEADPCGTCRSAAAREREVGDERDVVLLAPSSTPCSPDRGAAGCTRSARSRSARCRSPAAIVPPPRSARRRSCEQPISRTLPARTSSSSAPSVSSIGVAGSGKCSWYRSMRSVPSRRSLSSHGAPRRTSRLARPCARRRSVMPNLVATRPRCAARRAPAEELLALRAAVDVGGVEERDARIQRRVDHVLRRRLVDPPAEVVAAEPDDADVERSDFSCVHAVADNGAPRGCRAPTSPSRRYPSVVTRRARGRSSLSPRRPCEPSAQDPAAGRPARRA